MPDTPPIPQQSRKVRVALAIFYALPVLFVLGVCGSLFYNRVAHRPPPERPISAAPFATANVGPLTASLYTTGGSLRASGADLFIEFRDASGRFVDVGDVSFSLNLEMPGNILHSRGKVYRTSTPGEYRTTLVPGLAARWTATVSFTGPQGDAGTNFAVDVKP